MEKVILSKSEYKTIYRVDDKVYKVFSDSYDISQVLNEALNQAKIYEAGIPTPKVYGVKKFEEGYGIEMDYVEGVDLFTLLHKDKTKMSEQLDKFTEIHHKILSNNSISLINSFNKIKNKIFSSNLNNNLKYGLLYKLKNIEFDQDVIHGDFVLSNVMLDKKGDFIVLDWAHTAYGNRKMDIAVSYALMDVLDGKNDIANMYIDKMCNIESIKKEDILDLLILAYVYIIDRFDENKQKVIYDRIDKIIEENEA